ncbi:copper amine oxidase N-terminal domain-containing protein [Paenibacillus sp. MMS20-IR301]|uniref:copper amine oxidase N-terminal domain-containing protein n=1 Tax=Paenibacillus sp. MMS20-IR301 TaxID=2895946 RepID=UPI0028EDBE71|nr:copper amine oxidase N-terminal domain-containing protein [Paenibacillus sp. MMS20-IR301]WNS41040.1 copper amine oxidase N-terminal domain-containing protein [Paenibacillus sp. MMS20-IR301]
MKLIPGFLAVLALSGAVSLSAAAADKPITVTVNQQTLNLSSSSPVKDNDTILVPMRPIFEKLGLALAWDAKTSTVTASKEGLSIKLQIGSKKASVNGTVKQLSAAPRMINNVTYVPLRFVSEATGNEVSWDAKANTVAITSAADSSTAAKEIAALFDKYAEYSNSENIKGFMSLIDPKSPLAAIGPQLEEQNAKYDTKNTIEQLNIIDLQKDEATVQTVENSEKLGGAFILNSKAEYIYSLTKSSTGWLISNLQIKAIQYSLPAGTLEAKVTVPQADEDQINAVIQANVDYTNKENIDGILSTIDEASPAYAQTRQIYTQVFQAYDLESAIESSKIIDYTADEASVYMVQTTKRLSGPALADTRSTTVTTVKKAADGKWKLVQSYIIKTEPLTP